MKEREEQAANAAESKDARSGMEEGMAGEHRPIEEILREPDVTSLSHQQRLVLCRYLEDMAKEDARHQVHQLARKYETLHQRFRSAKVRKGVLLFIAAGAVGRDTPFYCSPSAVIAYHANSESREPSVK